MGSVLNEKWTLERLVGREKTHEIFDSFLGKVVRGKLKIQELHSAIFNELYSRGFRQSDWVAVMEDLERKDGIKRPLIDLLLSLSEERRLTLVLATRASLDSARWLARRYGFHHAIGSVEKVNGTFQGFETMIGARDDGNGTVTKLTAASRAMAASGKSLDPSRTAVIANDRTNQRRIDDSRLSSSYAFPVTVDKHKSILRDRRWLEGVLGSSEGAR